MTSITNYEYYTNTFGGTLIPSESFIRLEIKATSDLNYFTSNRLTSPTQITNEIQNVVCEIAELIYSQEQLKNNINSNGEIQSETVGSHSVTYVNKTSLINQQMLSDEDLMSKEYEICVKALIKTNLMFRGN